MNEVPQTRYAKSGDYHIAYQVVGNGPIDLVFIPSLHYAGHKRFDQLLRAQPATCAWHRSPA
jgi:hypothetical protein